MLRSLCCLTLLALSRLAAQPRVTNASLQTRSAAAGLEKEFRALVDGAATPAWIGYAVPIVAGEHRMCCWSHEPCTCTLEGSRGDSQTFSTSPVKLEGPRNMLVLFRAEQKKVGKIRTFTEDCPLDAGGLPFYWLSDVRPAESVKLLASFLTAAENRTRDGAVTALAFHAAPEALETLIGAARNDLSSRVRGQALFWLAQRAGQKVASTITEAIEQDPDTEVKKRAVFALSQIKEDGVPLLIQVARANRNPAVRKQAIFWLGQSHDSRALSFFEEILSSGKR